MNFIGLGVTSGTSLDGLDVCCAEFIGDLTTDIWTFRILFAHTFPYDDRWMERLANAPTLSGLELIKLHYEYSHFVGEKLQEFMVKMADMESPGGNPDPLIDFVCVNGHTVFHQPDQQLTFQLGDGEIMSNYMKCPLVTNFRVKDMSKGGQGAPATVAGCVDRFLFCGVGLCVNMGGVASIRVREDRAGWDVCACNIVLNKLAQMNDPAATFDKDGELASKGEIQKDVLSQLDKLEYYKQTGPKSIGMEWIKEHVLPILDEEKYSLADLARTYVEHIAQQICDACVKGNAVGSPKPEKYGDGVVLLTGGGYRNGFLLKTVKEKLHKAGMSLDTDMSEPVHIDYKEASAFAFLGVRCMLAKKNLFGDTTGSGVDVIAGSIHQPINRTYGGRYPDHSPFLFRQARKS